jgi:PAP_fibrillin
MTTSAKAQLLTLSASTDAGFESIKDAELISRIKALALEVEAANPTPEPTAHLAKMNGRWKLLYSSFGLERDTNLRRISFGTLPREAKIRVGEIFQVVDAATGRYDNHVEFTAQGIAGVHITRGQFVPDRADTKRLSITFTANAALAPGGGTPAPDLRAVLAAGDDDKLEAPLKFTGWSDVTYLDDDTRLMRGNAGNLYVLVRVAA